ncbi:MAG: 50S ribosomal protein L5 [Candidatus Marinimicrobia bacterium]|nr:50S ribosomal protein L5 [Candidatus Neomarinimicrobiota bacterium]
MAKTEKKYIPRLQKQYNESSISYLKDKLGIKNAMKIPKFEKIVLNMGIGEARDNATNLKNAIQEMTLITGQKAVVTYAKKAISNFKVREKDPMGVRVTLRGKIMFEFLDRFISVACPRVRDFSGFRVKGFDGMGNYNFGITEQIIFPEIDYDKIDKIRGMNITVVTSAVTDEQSFELLNSIGFPFRRSLQANTEAQA